MKSRLLLAALVSAGLSTAAFAGTTQTTTPAAKTATAKKVTKKAAAKKHCAKHATAPVMINVTPANISAVTEKQLTNKHTVLTVNTQDLTHAGFANTLAKKVTARKTHATIIITDAAQNGSTVVAGPSAARYFSALKTKTNHIVLSSDLAKAIGLTHVKPFTCKDMTGSFVEIK